jgi:spore maturation protein CgeB
MRILLVTGRNSYGDAQRGEAYEHQNFLPALRRLGHEVEVLDSLQRSDYPSFIELNRTVLARVEEWRPDLVLYVPVLYEIWTETWDIVREGGIPATLCWASDDSWKYSQSSRFLATHFDACATTYKDKVAKYHQDGYDRVLKSQWAADATRLQEPLPAAECEYDVSFVGMRYGNRAEYVKALTNAGIEVTCFGHGWPNGPIPGADIAPIFRKSKISLNFSGSGKWLERYRLNHRQIKARVFEVPGAGGFLLSEWAPGMEEFYDPDKEIDFFRTKTDLIAKVKFYLSHCESRDRRARAAYRRTINDHTYDSRMSSLVEFAIDQHRGMPKGTGKIDWAAFEHAASRHKITPLLELLRTALVKGCGVIFGRKRGPRVARRIIFEISWRIFGECTYSSKGVPGRLFYYES